MSSIIYTFIEKNMKITEHQEQVMLITWFRLAFPKYIIFAIPNGGARHIVTAVKLKAEGVLSGVPDLFLMCAKKSYNGMFIEMKAKGGKLSDSQKEFMTAAKDMDYLAVVCYGFDEAKIKIEEYLK